LPRKDSGRYPILCASSNYLTTITCSDEMRNVKVSRSFQPSRNSIMLLFMRSSADRRARCRRGRRCL
jgi:hypothetical protein